MSERQFVQRAPEPISKSTGAYLSIGVIVALVVGGTVAGIKWNTAEARATALAVELEDVATRQQTYIERRNAQHSEMTASLTAARDREVERCIWLAVRLDDDSIPCT